MRLACLIAAGLLLSGCASFDREIEGAHIRKTVSLIGLITPDGVALGPSYSMTAQLGPECRAVVIGESDLTLGELDALCNGEVND